MKIDVIKPSELSDEQVANWRNFLGDSMDLSSPFLYPEFTQVVSRHRDDIHVALLHEGTHHVGVFPFQRGHGHAAWPVAYRLNDFQAGILVPELELDTEYLLRMCDLTEWHFDHLIASQTCFQNGHMVRAESPCIDLTIGFDKFLSSHAATSRVKTVLRKERKLAREIGPIRFVFHTDEQSAFDSLISLKSQQLRRQKMRNVLEQDWVASLLNEIRTDRSPDCRGTMSVLFAGDELAAVHLGIRNERVIHWWFTAYNPKFERYSPGTILLLRLIEYASKESLIRLDLGKGNEPYKKSFQTGFIRVAEGALTRNGWNRAVQRTSYSLRSKLRSSPLRFVIRAAKRLLR